MRRVVYYLNGTVADFTIPDPLYDAFAERDIEIKVGPGEDLEKAQKALGAFVRQAAAGEREGVMGQQEAVAACYVWHHFNTTDEEGRIDGDVLVVDLDGNENEITYMALADAQLVEDPDA